MNKTGISVAIIMGAIVVIIGGLLYVKMRQANIAEAPIDIPTTAQGTEVLQDTTSTSKIEEKPTTTNTKPKTMTTATGLQITIVKEGTGEEAKAGNTVSVQYTGMLTNGTVFDSNVDPKFGHPEPFSFTLGENRVIAGWEQGVLGMKKGEKRHLVIPATLGYGAGGAGALIPPNATLEFDVEVMAIMP